MARKPRIRFRLTEDRNTCDCNVNGVSVQYQLSLADFGGERVVKLVWNGFFAAIDLEGEFELCLNVESCQLLVAKLEAFLKANVSPHSEESV